MNRQALDKLDFLKLLALISEGTHSPASRDTLMLLRPLENVEDIRLRSSQIDEIRRILQSGHTVRIEEFSDLTPLIRKNQPVGAMLDGIELYYFIPALSNFEELLTITNEHPELTHLKKITVSINGYPELLKRLRRSIDPEGNVLDTASTELKSLRDSIRRLENTIRKRLEAIVQSEEVALFLQDDFITQRSGRWVIPVRMDSKGQVAGVVHDVSKSGETAFIEPLSIINITNEMENLRAEEKAEEIRILKEIARIIRTNSEGILASFEALLYFDVLHAIALYAETMSMEMPLIGQSQGIRLYNARHPLLYNNMKDMGLEDRLVPLDISIESNRPVMIITGPNAGGKTVVLKTVGLLTLMALTGMPVPAASMSSFPMLNKILADIGDEQSLEDSLSTFAGHISNLSRFIADADNQSLILIDELGTGTDPLEGAALASAILQELRDTSAIVIANTHLSEIKGFVHRTEGMINASMEFDPRNLTPLYRLSIGMPGQSYAFETALRYGMPERIIESARQLLGSQKIELDNMIRELEDKRRLYEEMSKELEKRLAEADSDRTSLKLLLERAKKDAKDILSKGYKDAEELIDKTRTELFNLIEEAKKRDKLAIKAALKKTASLWQEIKNGSEGLNPPSDTNPKDLEKLKEGETVFSSTLEGPATVIHLNPKQRRVKIKAKGIEYDVPADDISPLRGTRNGASDMGVNEIPDSSASLTTINVVGKRVDEALSEIEPFLNHAFIAGLSEASIIHGIGTGILRKAIHNHLKGHNLINRYRSGSPAEGGAGVTIVSFQ